MGLRMDNWTPEPEGLGELMKAAEVLINQFYTLKQPIGANVMNPLCDALQACGITKPVTPPVTHDKQAEVTSRGSMTFGS